MTGPDAPILPAAPGRDASAAPVGVGAGAGAGARNGNGRLIRILRDNGDRMVGVAEQMLSSVVSMIGLIVLSRLMSVDDFGMFAFASGVWVILGMLQGSIVITPFLVACPDPLGDRAEFGAWLAWNLLFAVGAALLLALVGVALSGVLPWLAQGLLLSAPLALAGMLYMFARRVHYHLRRRGMLLVQSLSYAAVYGAGLALLAGGDRAATPAIGIAILALAYGLPGIVFMAAVARGARIERGFLSRIWQSRRLVGHLGAAGIIWEASNSGALLALAVFGTPAAVAVFSITLTLVRPLMLLMSTMIDVDLSRAVRAFAAEGAAGLSPVINRIWLTLAALSLPLAALLLAFPGYFLELVYGAQYAHATFELGLRVVLFLSLVYVVPLDIALTAARETRLLVRGNIIGVAAGAASLVLFGLLSQISTANALISLIVARLAAAPLFHLHYLRLIGVEAPKAACASIGGADAR